ncbi:MAG: anaerobic ribonucleoside-triphosphate reductase activating protein [Candidatus Altimarinota bacterium]
MIIAGLQKLTLLDYPGKIAAIVFTQGCNFACGYCHNPTMIPVIDEQKPELHQKNILKFFRSRRGLLDGIVVSGGEPTLQKGLLDFLEKVKEMDFLIKLDTNGSNPEKLRQVIKRGLVDYLALDVKATKQKYRDLVKNDAANKVLETISLIKNSGVDYEFRSTILPHCHDEQDIREMGEMIKGCKRWYLQSFRATKTLLRSFQQQQSFTTYELQHLQVVAEQYAERVEVRS